MKKFIKGAFVLAAAGMLCKLLGAVYRIPLGNLIGAQGMAFYQIAYPIYAVLVVVSTAGLPTAISKLVSEHAERGENADAHRVFRVAMTALFGIGSAGTMALVLAARPLAAAMGMPEASLSLMAIAPSLLLVALICAFRGYFQGLQRMGATAVSQVAEQTGKLIAGLALAAAWLRLGAQYSAAGALLGVTAGEALALLVIVLYYVASVRRLRVRSTAQPRISVRTALMRLFKIAAPITAGACLIPVVTAIDSAMVMRVLTSAGMAAKEAEGLFGLMSGFVMPIINMPAVFSLALAMSLVPSVAAARAGGRSVTAQASLGFRIAVMLGLPTAVGFFILARPILAVLYSSLTAQELDVCVTIMRVLSPGVLFLTLVQVLTGLLQGMGRTVAPVLNLCLGAVIKLALSAALMRIDAINVLGAAIGTAACYGFAAVLNTVCVFCSAGISPNIRTFFVKPLACTAVMGLFCAVFNIFFAKQLIKPLFLAMVILAAALLYAIILFKSGAVDISELLPGYKIRKRQARK